VGAEEETQTAFPEEEENKIDSLETTRSTTTTDKTAAAVSVKRRERARERESEKELVPKRKIYL